MNLDVDALLADPDIRVIVCCGSGGVGKTTTAAALALRAAEEHGRRTVVLTIDPARRLAQSLGLTELDNTPRQVHPIKGHSVKPSGQGSGRGSTHGRGSGNGELHAMMLDMKRTFDEVVAAHTDPKRAEEIYVNPFYQAMSSTFAGTQEYMAMEKLSQLRARDEWDLIVVDTPPSRSALDFLDAPARLSRFLDGRMLRMLVAPARSGGRSMFGLVTASFGVFSRLMDKILGAQLVTDVAGFVGALDNMFGGFRDRAEQTYRVLQAPETAFLVVAAPEPDAIREARYFAGRLSSQRMGLAGLVLNRVHQVATTEIDGATATAASERLRAEHPVAADVLLVHAAMMERADREQAVFEEFRRAHPEVEVAVVAAQPVDVHDIDGLRKIGVLLAGRASAQISAQPAPDPSA
jgi:anion-transporting  ArsA/GET3 family ATPase